MIRCAERSRVERTGEVYKFRPSSGIEARLRLSTGAREGVSRLCGLPGDRVQTYLARSLYCNTLNRTRALLIPAKWPSSSIGKRPCARAPQPPPESIGNAPASLELVHDVNCTTAKAQLRLACSRATWRLGPQLSSRLLHTRDAIDGPRVRTRVSARERGSQGTISVCSPPEALP